VSIVKKCFLIIILSAIISTPARADEEKDTLVAFLYTRTLKLAVACKVKIDEPKLFGNLTNVGGDVRRMRAELVFYKKKEVHDEKISSALRLGETSAVEKSDCEKNKDALSRARAQ
jgi:hypothetical protein